MLLLSIHCWRVWRAWKKLSSCCWRPPLMVHVAMHPGWRCTMMILEIWSCLTDSRTEFHQVLVNLRPALDSRDLSFASRLWMIFQKNTQDSSRKPGVIAAWLLQVRLNKGNYLCPFVNLFSINWYWLPEIGLDNPKGQCALSCYCRSRNISCQDLKTGKMSILHTIYYSIFEFDMQLLRY